MAPRLGGSSMDWLLDVEAIVEVVGFDENSGAEDGPSWGSSSPSVSIIATGSSRPRAEAMILKGHTLHNRFLTQITKAKMYFMKKNQTQSTSSAPLCLRLRWSWPMYTAAGQSAEQLLVYAQGSSKNISFLESVAK